MTFRELFIETANEVGMPLGEMQARLEAFSNFAPPPEMFDRPFSEIMRPGMNEAETIRLMKAALKLEWFKVADPEQQKILRAECEAGLQKIEKIKGSASTPASMVPPTPKGLSVLIIDMPQWERLQALKAYARAHPIPFEQLRDEASGKIKPNPHCPPEHSVWLPLDYQVALFYEQQVIPVWHLIMSRMENRIPGLEELKLVLEALGLPPVEERIADHSKDRVYALYFLVNPEDKDIGVRRE